MKADIIIIGAGPAGLFTAIQASKTNHKTIILEKNPEAGKKLLITGAGQCNLTQEGNIKDFLDHYGENYRFLRQALYTFPNKELIEFFQHKGIKFTTTNEGKIFPASLKAADILDVLLQECKDKKIDIKYSQAVKDVQIDKENRFIISTNKNKYKSNFLVIATGGQSYPGTGSSGDGYYFTKSLGHSIVKPTPALTPLYIKDYPFSEISGISLPARNISLWRDNKLIKRWSGDILFTHHGISGPGILNYSRYIKPNDIIKLKLINIESHSLLEKEILKMISKNGKLLIKNLLNDFPLPHRLIDKIIELARIPRDKRAAELNKNERKNLIKLLLELALSVERPGKFNQAMVTKGGINLKEINPKTMESRIIDNLYAVGEILDIDGDTGGYNLQAAFSTAYLAGQSILKKL
ncbi:MAG: NAD(P)/FAD-dependent oxidoreductase [Halanaerobiaceae bacterium]